jgi:hypothetical protein
MHSNSYHCPFAKALLCGHSHCQHAESFHIAERHGMQCRVPTAQALCDALALQLHQQSRFALGVTHLPQQMTSNMELRIQCGGITGVAECAAPSETAAPVDVFDVVEQAISRFGSIEEIPYSRVVQSINQWKARRRGQRGRD